MLGTIGMFLSFFGIIYARIVGRFLGGVFLVCGFLLIVKQIEQHDMKQRLAMYEKEARPGSGERSPRRKYKNCYTHYSTNWGGKQ